MLNYTLHQSMHLKRQARGFAITRDSVYCYLFLHFIKALIEGSGDGIGFGGPLLIYKVSCCAAASANQCQCQNDAQDGLPGLAVSLLLILRGISWGGTGGT